MAINEYQTSQKSMVIFNPHSCKRGEVEWEKSKDTCKPYNTPFTLRCLPVFSVWFLLEETVCHCGRSLSEQKSVEGWAILADKVDQSGVQHHERSAVHSRSL